MEKIRLHIGQITPGMKLAEPITNASGITLMPAGIRLTPMFIARIKKWNIETLDVLMDRKRAEGGNTTKVQSRSGDSGDSGKFLIRSEQGDPNAVPEEQEQFARTVASEISRVFVDVRSNPLMMKLRISAIKRLVAQGPDAVINVLRRGPLDEIPLPEEGI